MIYRDKAQAELERDMNEREIGGTWTVTQWERDGIMFYEPIRQCPQSSSLGLPRPKGD